MISLFSIITNRYLLASAAFVCWMLFFDKNNLFLRVERTRELTDLNKRIDFYETEIAYAKDQLGRLKNDPATLEQYAREQYFMKRSNEQIFVFDSLRKPDFISAQH